LPYFFKPAGPSLDESPARQQNGISLPQTHSSQWTPVRDSLETVIMAETAMLLDLLGNKQADSRLFDCVGWRV
jgi:hypothetical protein